MPGDAFALATSSWMFVTPSDGCATNTSGELATSVMGVKSLSVSYGSGRSAGLIECVVLHRKTV